MIPGPEQQEIEQARQERRQARKTRRHQQLKAKYIAIGTISVSVGLLLLMGLVYYQLETLLALPAAISGVRCDQGEQAGYHIHAHLSIYINGKPVPLPANIGIAGKPPTSISCFYWLHTHKTDGIIHIEAPQQLHNLALDDFLTIWQNGFSNLGFPPELKQSTGWHVYVNGKLFTSVPVTLLTTTEVPLNSHDIVTIEYGQPLVPPDTSTTYKFPTTLPQ